MHTIFSPPRADYGNLLPSMYRLLFQSRTVPRSPVTSDAACLSIGRAPACGLRLTEAGIGDQHAAIDRRRDGYFIRDLTASNGVHLNGLAVTDQRLTTGDEVELGAVRFVFEVVHEPPPERRTFDPWQLAGAGIVALLITGQLALLAWIFLQPHPPHPRTDIVPRKAPEAPRPASAPTMPSLTPLASSVGAPATAPEILSRMLKIVRINRSDATTLRILVLARVGDRQLDPGAITVSVQCFRAPAKPGATLWLTIPARWENFSSQELIAHLPEPSAGYIVRTYYRQQPQDVEANPPGLLPSQLP